MNKLNCTAETLESADTMRYKIIKRQSIPNLLVINHSLFSKMTLYKKIIILR